MNDDQQSFRFVIPGFAAVTVTGLAFAITFPRMLCYVTQLEPGGWITAIVGSGALGFLLSQAYFALPCSLIDYRDFFKTQSFEGYLRSMVRAEHRKYVEELWKQALAKPGWRGRRVAYSLGTFLWQKLIADRNKELNSATSRAAARAAAIGATWIGVAVGFLVFLGWSGILCAHAMSLFILRGFPPYFTCWRPVFGALIFLIVLVFLRVAHRRLCELNQRLVLLGLATCIPPDSTDMQGDEPKQPLPPG